MIALLFSETLIYLIQVVGMIKMDHAIYSV